MPELPEVEITARRLSAGVAGARVESALAPGLVALKTFDPPLDALAGRELDGVRRIGKMLAVEAGDLTLLVHLMSAGRLQLFDARASLRDRASRILVRLEDGRELRLREFGTQQRAWAKLLNSDAVADDEAVARSARTPTRRRRSTSWRSCSTSRATCTRCCATSARSPASAARGWTSCSGPRGSRRSRRAPTSSDDEVEALHAACDEVLGGALATTRRSSATTIPDKMPMPLKVHRRAGEECPRCGTRIEAIHFKDYVMCYCPEEQTGGRVLKDRRLSRLLK